jgi:hypothetical protein
MLSTDGGATWAMTRFATQSAMAGKVDPSPATPGRALQLTASDLVFSSACSIVVAIANEFVGAYTFSSSPNNRGIWRSTDDGLTWTKALSLSDGVLGMVADPTDASFLMATSTAGLYKSTNGGATWTRLSSASVTAKVYNAYSPATEFTIDNAVLSISRPGGAGSMQAIWAGFCSAFDEGKYSVHRSIDGGNTWMTMAFEPGTMENGEFINLGTQCLPNFSMLADPTDINYVYVGGATHDDIESSIGNKAYGARMFRGLATGTTLATMWVSLTNRPSTSRNSAPHADTRRFVWDATNSWLISTNDGGVYYRTLPRGNTGDWYSLNGDLAIQELLSAAYNPANGQVIMGAQDTACTITQPSLSVFMLGQGLPAKGINSGDGGYVNINPSNGLVQHTSQYLGLEASLPSVYFISSPILNYSVYTYPIWNDARFGDETDPMQPIVLANAIDPRLLCFCISSPTYACYSIHAPTAATGTSTMTVVALAPAYYESYVFGGSRNGATNVNVFLAVTSAPFVKVYQRQSTATPAAITPTGTLVDSWSYITSLATNPTNYFEALLTCGISGKPGSNVFLSLDFGSTWTLITGNLLAASGAAVDFAPTASLIMNVASGGSSSTAIRAYLVGTFNGVFVSYSSANTVWKRLGTPAEFPLVIVSQLRWYAQGDVLLVATLGRSVYSMVDATAIVGYSRDCACPAYRVVSAPSVASRAAPFAFAPIIYNVSFVPAVPTSAPTAPPVVPSSSVASITSAGVPASISIVFGLQGITVVQMSNSSFRTSLARSIASVLNICLLRVNVSAVSTTLPNASSLSNPRIALQSQTFFITVVIIADPGVGGSGTALTTLAGIFATMAVTPNSALALQITLNAPGVTVDSSLQPIVSISSFTCPDGTVLAAGPCPIAAPPVSGGSSGLSTATIAVLAGVVGALLMIACLWVLCIGRASAPVGAANRYREKSRVTPPAVNELVGIRKSAPAVLSPDSAQIKHPASHALYKIDVPK